MIKMTSNHSYFLMFHIIIVSNKLILIPYSMLSQNHIVRHSILIIFNFFQLFIILIIIFIIRFIEFIPNVYTN